MNTFSIYNTSSFHLNKKILHLRKTTSIRKDIQKCLKHSIWTFILYIKRLYTKLKLYLKVLKKHSYTLKRLEYAYSQHPLRKKIIYKLKTFCHAKKRRGYKHYRALTLFLHRFTKRLLSKNIKITRLKGRRPRYLTRILIYKRDLRDQYCTYLGTNYSVFKSLKAFN